MKDSIELLESYFDGDLDEAGSAELSARVTTSPAEARRIVEAAMLHQSLREVLYGRRRLEDEAILGDSLNDAVIMPAIRLIEEDEAEHVETPAPYVMPPKPALAKPGKKAWVKPRIRWRWTTAAAIAICLLTGWLLMQMHARSTRVPGTLVSTIGAAWEDQSQAPQLGGPLKDGSLSLLSGLAQFRLHNGVSLIFEGPARFEVRSDFDLFLGLGKVTVKVPHGVSGFAVNTPSSRTVDLGTEFGVNVDSSGNTETHVITGTVEMTPIAGGVPTKLTVDAAARIDTNSSSSYQIPSRASNFVREVPTIDLADIVAGGDGTQGRRNVGINVSDGSIRFAPPPETANKVVFRSTIRGDGKFHSCTERRMIAGVFVPHGGTDADTLDPAANRFNFPTTDNNSFFWLWAGGSIPSKYPVAPASTFMGTIDYATPPHCMLVMSSNIGVCFDLDAVRRAHPDRPFSQLKGVVANLAATTEVHARPGSIGASNRAEFWVFIDGQLQLRRLILRSDGPFDVEVPVVPAAHYLTLVVTDGGDGFNWDWIAFGDPRLN